MTYVQRATKDGVQRAPFFYAISETKDEMDRRYTQCVAPNGIDQHFLSREFFKPFIVITEKEFLAAKAAVQHTLDSFGTEKN